MQSLPGTHSGCIWRSQARGLEQAGVWTASGRRVDHGGGVWNTHAAHAVTCTTEQVRAHIRNPFIYMLAGVTMPDLGSG